jgi:arabinose-5-phosphate isomerase
MDQELRQFALQVIRTEAAAIESVAAAVDDHFERAARLILNCPGALLTTGVGKTGIIARKLSSSFSSTGTPSHFLDPAHAVHGDVGSLRRGDLVLVLSDSGETDEILRMLNVIKKLGHSIIAITSSRTSTLGRFCDVVLSFGKVQEACPLGLAPSASTTAMLALGDALFLTVMHLRQFTVEDFALYHPAGQLGRKLIKVGEAMTFRLGENLPIVSDRLTVGQVLHEASAIKRRCGAVILVDDAGKISGLFSDGDLRRLMTDNNGSAMDRPIRQVMTHHPKRVHADSLAAEAMAVLKQHRIDELPVVDSQDRPVGLIDVQDLVVLKMFDVGPDA